MADPSDFGTITASFRTLFQAFIGSYSYLDDYPNYAMSYQILMIMHVFVSNIFLMNYLVAILSTVYSYMTEVGEFQFRVKKYEFIEKYSIPMLEEGYKELVLHPAPVNFFTIPLYLGIINRSAMKKIGNYFSKIMYWLETIPFIFLFILYEFVIMPIAYFKQIVNFIFKSNWRNILCLLPFWVLCGPFIIFFIGFLGDIMNLMTVLFDYGEM